MDNEIVKRLRSLPFNSKLSPEELAALKALLRSRDYGIIVRLATCRNHFEDLLEFNAQLEQPKNAGGRPREQLTENEERISKLRAEGLKPNQIKKELEKQGVILELEEIQKICDKHKKRESRDKTRDKGSSQKRPTKKLR